jgi:ubiquinone/menaquinone biosynthesis C-methylase UbiE
MPNNNKEFWDEYVKKFEANPENKKYKLLGNNWKGEDIFLQLLSKYRNPEGSALEIGCGGGRITLHASNFFKTMYATDISSEMVRKASSEVKNSNVIWQTNDGFTLNDFKNESIDFAFSHDVFVHFSSMQTYPYLKHIYRVLKPNGIGIISFYNFIKHFQLFKNESWRFNTQHIFPPTMRHHFITQEMLTTMLTDLKYNALEWNTDNFLIVVFQKRG